MSTTTDKPDNTENAGAAVQATASPDPNDFEQPDVPVPGGKVLDRIVPPGGSPSGSATWAIDARTLKCVKQQETGLTGGDEVYIASLTLRSTPGKAGSTRVRSHGNLQDITKVKTGTTHAVPSTMGRVTFANVTRRSLADVQAGRNPELTGTLSAVFESDLTGKKPINNLLQKAATEVEPIVAGLIEPLTLADIANPQQLSARFADAARDIERAIRPKVGKMIELFLRSAGDPDDFIAARLNLFVAVDDSLAGLVDQAVGAAVPSQLGVAGALRPRTYTQRFAGDGAIYDITFHVEA